MPKLGEINYLRTAGPDGARHVREKPFSDALCGRYLGDMGVVMSLLPPPPARVLDLGVGSGWTTLFLARRGYSVVGWDICPDMISLAEENRERLDGVSAEFAAGDYESLSYRGGFDAVLFHDALHHAEDERAALISAFNSLDPGGICITVEPGEGHAAASEAAAAAFGVTEKDMPPHQVIAMGREVGFRRFRVYPRTGEPVPSVTAGATGALQLAICRPRWSIAAGFARKAFRALLMGARPGDGEFLQNSPASRALRAGNIVWMQK